MRTDYVLAGGTIVQNAPAWWSVLPRPVIEWGLPISDLFALLAPALTPALTMSGVRWHNRTAVRVGTVIALLSFPSFGLVELWGWLPFAAALALFPALAATAMSKASTTALRWAWATTVVGLVLLVGYVAAWRTGSCASTPLSVLP